MIPRPAAPAQTDLTVADRLTRDERELLAAYRRLRSGKKTGIIVVYYQGSLIQVCETMPGEVVQA